MLDPSHLMFLQGADPLSLYCGSRGSTAMSKWLRLSTGRVLKRLTSFMVDLIEGRVTLSDFSGIVIGGGFSFGDVFGAGRGWASLILQRNQLRDMFEEFFQNTSKFALGVCKRLPGACRAQRDRSGRTELAWICAQTGPKQFEARLVMTEISSAQSILTHGMQGRVLPVAVAHGEGTGKVRNRRTLSESCRCSAGLPPICLTIECAGPKPIHTIPTDPMAQLPELPIQTVASPR